MLRFTRNADAQFWTDFVAEHWEQTPVLMDAGDLSSPLTLDDLFKAITSMADRGPADRFWLARIPQPTSMADFVQLDLNLMGPQASDGDFDGFFGRLAEHSYGVNIHRLGSALPTFDDLTADIATALAGEERPKVQAWLSDTFFGNYRATPFGIHRDPAGVFSFTLHGTRTYYMWPPEAFAPNDPDLGTIRPDVLARHLPDAERFDVGPGSVVYWPSNRWHLVASPGEPFVVAQVSAHFKPAHVNQAR